ncbi:YdcF family protein [Ferrovibrio terrae]|uniref:YdcF family protein n=1 Tax=Ferrovibrio terrae TaxID=2594003 RepID=UPI003138051E
MPRNDDETAPSFFTRIWRWLVLLAVLCLLWLGGSIAYVERVELLAPPTEAPTDAIVVLTGGAARMGTALRLLHDGKAERLLVSGVAQTTTKASLQQAALPTMPDAAQASSNWQGIDLQLLFECCVDLGFEADDTAGNAAETVSWATARGYKTIRLVTANYHMPRALVEFGRIPSGITILPHPVRSDAMRVEDWWQRRTATVFLLGEYSKYIAALLRAHLGSQLAATVAEKPAAEKPAAEKQEKPQ